MASKFSLTKKAITALGIGALTYFVFMGPFSPLNVTEIDRSSVTIKRMNLRGRSVFFQKVNFSDGAGYEEVGIPHFTGNKIIIRDGSPYEHKPDGLVDCVYNVDKQGNIVWSSTDRRDFNTKWADEKLEEVRERFRKYTSHLR